MDRGREDRMQRTGMRRDRMQRTRGTRDRGTSRPDWVFMLTRDQIQDYTMEQVLGGTDGWNPGA